MIYSVSNPYCKGDEGDNARAKDQPKERASHRLKAARKVCGKFTPELFR